MTAENNDPQRSNAFLRSVETLKAECRSAIQDAVTRFEARTGLTPSVILPDIQEITGHGDWVKRYAVGDVRVGFGDY